MAISFTYHGGYRAEDSSGHRADALRKPLGIRTAVADAAASSTLTASGWYRIAASTSSYVLISSEATNGTGGEHFPAGSVEVRWIDAGEKIGCSTGA